MNHQIARLLPDLHGLATLVNDTPALNRTADMDELVELLGSLRTGFANLAGEVEELPQQLRPAASVEQTILGNNSKRDRRHLLPPSPERRQKRKDSHAPY